MKTEPAAYDAGLLTTSQNRQTEILYNHTWSPVSTNTLTSGSSYFSDPQWKNHPARFYRLRSQ